MTDPQDVSRRNQRERAATVERILRSVDPELEAHSYPVRREELAAHYGDTAIELPNETESLGDVFDRLTDREYDTPREAREAALGEITGAAVEEGEYNLERDLEPDEAGQLGTTADPLAADGEPPTETEPRSDPDAVAEESNPDGVFDGTEAVEPNDREVGDHGEDIHGEPE